MERFNIDLYYAVRKAREQAGIAESRWSFALNQSLGPSGALSHHPLIGSTLQCINITSPRYGTQIVIKSVNLHWLGGYYWWAVGEDSERSSVIVTWNLNCEECPFDSWSMDTDWQPINPLPTSNFTEEWFRFQSLS